MFLESTPPEALFTLKNSITIDTFEVLQKHSIEIPRTVALLGYDDFQLAETVRPSISVIHQPVDEIGHLAAALLFKRVLGTAVTQTLNGSSSPRQILRTTRLIRRASCGCSPTA